MSYGDYEIKFIETAVVYSDNFSFRRPEMLKEVT